MSYGDIPSRLRDPEYTGANRCAPCTVVNLVIAAGVAVAASAVLSPVAGTLAFAASAGAIYLRGYLVPGTPTLTQRYFPAWLLAAFGKRPPEAETETHRVAGAPATATEAGTGAGAADESDGPETEGAAALVAAGVIRDDPEGAGVDLTPAFRAEWTDRAAALAAEGVDEGDVRAAFGADAVTAHGDLSFVVDGERVVGWESHAALAADVAAATLLRERVADWSDRESDRRRLVLTGLRFCLDRCLGCDGRLSVTERRVDPCCRPPRRVAEAVCEACDATVADAAVAERDGSEPIRSRLLRA